MTCISIMSEDGEEQMFRQVLFLVEDKHPSGTPRRCRLILDDEQVEITENSEFCTALIPEVLMKDA